MIDVVCGIIRKEGLVLVAQRGPGQQHAGLWEFPGGKVQPGETPVAALQRELLEELSITVSVAIELPAVIHKYEAFTIRLIPWVADYEAGEILLHEHAAIAWVAPHALLELEWTPADVPIVHYYLQHVV